MPVAEIFVAFHRPRGWRYLRRSRDWPSCFGHVEAFGIMLSGDWFFIDPSRRRMNLDIEHRHDEVQEMILDIHERADLILSVEPVQGPLLPPICPMTCASVIGHLVGVRAFTLGGLERSLRRIGANEVKNAGPEGR